MENKRGGVGREMTTLAIAIIGVAGIIQGVAIYLLTQDVENLRKMLRPWLREED